MLSNSTIGRWRNRLWRDSQRSIFVNSRALWFVFYSLLLAREKMMSYHAFFTFSSQARISGSCSWWK